jgi:hypothetical protein
MSYIDEKILSDDAKKRRLAPPADEVKVKPFAFFSSRYDKKPGDGVQRSPSPGK